MQDAADRINVADRLNVAAGAEFDAIAGNHVECAVRP
jgi:hypothetical protein